MPGTFSPPPWVGDPGMHHGTCVTHVPWCMLGSLTIGFIWSRWRGKRSRHSRFMCNPQFHVSSKRSMLKNVWRWITWFHSQFKIYLMVIGRCDSSFEWLMSYDLFWVKFIRTSNDIFLRRGPQDTVDDNQTLIGWWPGAIRPEFEPNVDPDLWRHMVSLSRNMFTTTRQNGATKPYYVHYNKTEHTKTNCIWYRLYSVPANAICANDVQNTLTLQ